MPRKPQIFSDPDTMIRELIPLGAYLHLAATMSRPNALIYALARQFFDKDPKFTVSVAGLHSSAHALTMSGVLSKIITGFAGDNYPRPQPNALYSNILKGEPFEAELWSLLTLVQRLQAGAMRLPGFVTNSLVRTDMITDKLGKTVHLYQAPDSTEKDPNRFAVIQPLHPDYTLIHAVLGDEDGNLVLTHPSGEGVWGAMAATKGVVASCERIVPSGSIPAELISIPGTKVIGLCEANFGAHPQSLRVFPLPHLSIFKDLSTYMDDYEFQIEANQAAAGEEKFRKRWMEEWVYARKTHEEYLGHLGSQRLRKLKQLPQPQDLMPAQDPESVNDSEQMIILAARAIMEHVKRRGYTTLLAGIGAAHIACWTAARLLEKEGIRVHVMTELGFYSMTPSMGDVFLFSQLHANGSQGLSDITQILGMLVPDKCLGVMGAAEIDWFGNVNSIATSKGKFIVGSGGANDIASTADCIIVAKAIRQRYVRKVNFITTNGDRVKEAVCQFGRFRRDKMEHIFEFTNWIAPPSDPEMDSEEAVLKFTNWFAPDEVPPKEEPKPTSEELTILRSLDPERIYIEQFMVYRSLPGE
ncbi:acetate CoA-transferase [Leptospira ryugenii]|uniref:Acetate CoA-transferase n=1 Tax=Leptospira ryugenii TaxID=1917863 RepID=A0A2P2E1Z0_9LEPT|nr:CoA-transferase [Leptospira ryugenii]GBF50908.1 acetate CoA-transferase [Leptospira ryugenii]